MPAETTALGKLPARAAAKRWCLQLGASALLTQAACVLAEDHTPSAPAERETLLLEIQVLGRALPGIFEVEQRADGQLVLPVEAWTQARLLPAGAALTLANQQHGYALNAVPALRYRIDRSRLMLEISAPPAAFDASQVMLYDGQSAPPGASPPGAYLDYDISATQAQGGHRVAALLQGVAFAHDSSVVIGAAVRMDPRDSGVVRNESYWRKDYPESMQTLVLGDSVGQGGMWSQPARFAGVHFGRDFSLAPGYVSYPMPSISGAAALPSTVDVLINNQLSVSTEVPTGPFSLNNVPIVTGAGQMQLVVRDLLGRETVIQQDYYVSPQILRSGLTDFSFEAGALRQGFGSRSNAYGDWFTAGTWRQGLSDSLTSEWHAELQQQRQAAGAGLSTVLGQIGVLSVAAGYAIGNGERGGRYLLGFQHAGSVAGVSLSLEHNDQGFAPFATNPSSVRVKDQWGGSAGWILAQGVSLGVSYARRTTWSADRFTLAGASLGVSLPRNAYLSLNASKQLGGGGWSCGAQVIVALDARTSTAISSRRSAGATSVNAIQATRSLPSGPGWGWTIGASDDSARRAQGLVGYIGNQGEISAEAVLNHGAGDVRLAASGAIGWLHGLAFATRRIDQGAFAVVRVGDVANVPVSLSNQVVALTNDQGLALVPRLLPFQANQLTIAPEQLPLNVEIRGVREAVIPYARSGVLVDFPVRHSRAALVVLHRADGMPVPAGARVVVSPGEHAFVVFRRGEAYLTDLEEQSRISVRWPGGGCDLSLPLVPAAPGAAAPTIGPLTCAGAQ